MNIKKMIKSRLTYYDISSKIYKLHCKGFNYNNKKHNFLAQQCRNKIFKKYNCWIESSANISENINFPHPTGIVIGALVKIGKNCTIYQNVTIGRKYKDKSEYPTIGDNVIIYANSVIVGNVKIGNNAVIGCNSVVLRDVADNEVVSGIVK